MADPAQGFTIGDRRDRRTYEDARTKRLQRRRLVAYALSIALWLISAVPLLRLTSDEGGGAAVVAIYLAGGLAVAFAIRGVYALKTRRRFFSPWLFVIAAILSIMSHGIQTAGDEPLPPQANEGPVSQ